MSVNNKIRLVDGEKIRNSIDINFAGCGSQADYLYIPRGEFWAEKELRDEAPYFLKINEFATNYRGQNLREAIKKEFLKKIAPRLFKIIRHQPTQYLSFVDGRMVRRALDPWFFLGGHSLVYNYIPHGEIWVDCYSPPDEYQYTIAHERHEYHLMTNGESYDNAHDFALAFEKKLRRLNGACFYEDAYPTQTVPALIKTFYVK